MYLVCQYGQLAAEQTKKCSLGMVNRLPVALHHVHPAKRKLVANVMIVFK